MGGRPDVIIRVTEGTGAVHMVTWAPISNTNIHTRDADSQCTGVHGPPSSPNRYPSVCPASGLWLVSNVATDHGTAGTRHFRYHYRNARADGQGRGWLGFSERQELDTATGMVSTTTFDNSTKVVTGNPYQYPSPSYAYPYAGLPATEATSVALDNGNEFTHRRVSTYQYTPEFPLPVNGGNFVYSLLPPKGNRR
jgi:hypothetical protein